MLHIRTTDVIPLQLLNFMLTANIHFKYILFPIQEMNIYRI